MGTGEMPLLVPVTLSVSASISCRTSSKSVNFLDLQCKNSAYSEKGRKMLEMRKRSHLTRRQGADGLLGQVPCQAEKVKGQSQWLQEFGEQQIYSQRKRSAGVPRQPGLLPDRRGFLKEQKPLAKTLSPGREQKLS